MNIYHSDDIKVSSSGCHDLRVTYINDANDGGCAAGVFGRCMLWSLHALSSLNQLIKLTGFLRTLP